MATAFRLWEMAQVIQLLDPATDAAGRTSKYWSLKNAHKAYIIFTVQQGNAATILLTPLQATDNTGAGSKGLTAAAPIANNIDTDTVPADVLTIAAAATTFTTDAGVKNKMVIFEIDPIESMDINNNFNHLGFSTGASNAANLTSALLLLMPIRFAQLNPPTAFV